MDSHCRSLLLPGAFPRRVSILRIHAPVGVPIDKIALLTVLNVCTKAGALEQGRRVRGYCDESGLSADVAVATAIVNLYGKCRELNEAIAVFEETEVTRNIVTWTVMVAAYAQAGHCKEAFGCVMKMLLEGILPNEFTFVNALGSCGGGGGGDLARERMLHVWIRERGMESNSVLANALVGMYSRCGGVDEAAKVFDSVRSGARDVVMWTSMIAAYGLFGFFEAAFRVFQMMLLEGVRPDRVSFITVLTSVMPAQAQAVRNLVCECGFDTDVVVGTALVEMLSRGGKLSSAREAFDRITHPAVASWSALMSAMVEHGYHAEAVITFRSRLLLEGLEIDKIALLTILGACSSPIFLPFGKLIHSFIASSGFELDLVVGNALIGMYGSCRDLRTAREVFTRLLPFEDVVSWNSMIAACTESGQHGEALVLFYKMQLQGMAPDRITFILVLSSISVSKQERELRDLERIHELVRSTGLDQDSEVEGCLFWMFTSCSFSEEAAKRCPNVYRQEIASTDDENVLVAVQKFRRMQLDGCIVSSMTLVSVLNLCSRAGFLELGRAVHCWISNGHNYMDDQLVRASVIRLYGKCGQIDDARAAFEAGDDSYVLWNAFVVAFADSWMPETSLHALQSMQLEGFQADEITLASILNACESSQDLKVGKKIHEQVVRSGWESNTVLGTAVISMYGRCGSLDESFLAFNTVAVKDLVNAMITACVQHEDVRQAWQLFRLMLIQGMKLTKATFVAVPNACCSSKDGKFVMSCIQKTGSCETDTDILLGNALITMHGRCGEFVAAKGIFDAMAAMDVISWNALMVATEKDDDVVKLFHQMQLEGFRLNKASFVNLLSAASANSNSRTLRGRTIQDLAVQAQVFHHHDIIKHSFINLYAKLGDLNQAKAVFDDISSPALVSWNSIIAANSRSGTAAQTLELFLEMQHRGIAPNGITFVSILSACSHSGQAEDGLFYFLSMTSDYGVPSGQEHQGCMVDLLSRSGRLGVAEDLMSKNEQDGSLQWMSLLGACHIQNDAQRGMAVAERFMGTRSKSCAAHVVLYNLLRAPI